MCLTLCFFLSLSLVCSPSFPGQHPSVSVVPSGVRGLLLAAVAGAVGAGTEDQPHSHRHGLPLRLAKPSFFSLTLFSLSLSDSLWCSAMLSSSPFFTSCSLATLLPPLTGLVQSPSNTTTSFTSLQLLLLLSLLQCIVVLPHHLLIVTFKIELQLYKHLIYKDTHVNNQKQIHFSVTIMSLSTSKRHLHPHTHTST